MTIENLVNAVTNIAVEILTKKYCILPITPVANDYYITLHEWFATQNYRSKKDYKKKTPTKNKINICLISLNISECSHIYVPSALMFWLLTEKNEEIRHITKNKYKCTLLYPAKQHLKYLQK